jgi:DNA modification methylase
MDIQLLCGDALEVLKTLPSESVHCIVTSPPYYGLRDYGVDGQLGCEKTPDEYVAKLVIIFHEAWRVLHKTGTFWLNIGDSYNANGRKGHGTRTGYKQGTNRASATGSDHTRSTAPGLKEKDLIGIPWMLAFALRADGWYLRSDIIWHKSNAMPESVTDRPTKAHEYLFLLSKSPKYFYDHSAIKEPSVYPEDDRKARASTNHKTMPTSIVNGMRPRKQDEVGNRRYTGFNDRWDKHEGPYITRNKRSVWNVATRPFKGAHFATFNPELITPCVLAGSSEKGICPKCNAPWVHDLTYKANYTKRQDRGQPDGVPPQVDSTGWKPATVIDNGWCPSCKCGCEPVPAVVLDPFNGAATTGLVAQKLGRNYIGIDLNPEYIEMSRKRLGVAL